MLSEARQNFLPFGLHQVAMQSATGKALLQHDTAVKGGVGLLTVGILANTSVKTVLRRVFRYISIHQYKFSHILRNTYTNQLESLNTH